MAPPTGQRVDWKRLVPGGSIYVTHDLMESGQGLVFQRTPLSLLVAVLRLLFATTFVAGGAISLESGDRSLGLVLLVTGLSLSAAALVLLFERPVRFDTTLQLARIKGRHIAFADVAAVQLLGEGVQDEEGEPPYYESYELNLVLRDGTRLNLVDHVGRGQLEREGKTLAQAIGCEFLDEKVDGVAMVRRS